METEYCKRPKPQGYMNSSNGRKVDEEGDVLHHADEIRERLAQRLRSAA